MRNKEKKQLCGIIIGNLLQHYIDELKLNRKTGNIHRWIFLYDSKDNNEAIRRLISRGLVVEKKMKGGSLVSLAEFNGYPTKGDNFVFHGNEADIYTIRGSLSPVFLRDLAKSFNDKIKKASAI